MAAAINWLNLIALPSFVMLMPRVRSYAALHSSLIHAVLRAKRLNVLLRAYKLGVHKLLREFIIKSDSLFAGTGAGFYLNIFGCKIGGDRQGERGVKNLIV